VVVVCEVRQALPSVAQQAPDAVHSVVVGGAVLTLLTGTRIFTAGIEIISMGVAPADALVPFTNCNEVVTSIVPGAVSGFADVAATCVTMGGCAAATIRGAVAVQPGTCE
jgi:hypothetical protein